MATMRPEQEIRARRDEIDKLLKGNSRRTGRPTLAIQLNLLDWVLGEEDPFAEETR